MYEFLPFLIASGLIIVTGFLLAWAIVLMHQRLQESRHVCWSDETFCEECIDDRHRALAPHAYR